MWRRMLAGGGDDPVTVTRLSEAVRVERLSSALEEGCWGLVSLLGPEVRSKPYVG